MTGHSVINRRFVRTLPWAAVEGGTTIASGLLTTVIIGRNLDAAAVGLAGLSLSTVALIEIGSAAGIQDAVVRAPSAHTSFTDSAHWAAIILAVVGLVACAGCGWLLSGLFSQPVLVPLTACAGLSLLFNALAAVPGASLTRKMRAAALARRTALGKLSALLCLLALALLGSGPWSIVISYVLGTFASAAVILWSAVRLPRILLNFHELRSLVGFASLLSVESILWVAAVRLFGMIFGYFHGVTEYGALQFAFRLVDDLATLIQRTILRFGLAYFSALARSEIDARHSFLQGSKLLTALATPIFAGIALTAGDLVPTLFGAQWRAAVPLVQIVAFSWLFGFPRSLVGPILRAEGKQIALVRYAAVMAVFMVGGALLTAKLSAAVATIAFCLRQVLAVPWGLVVIQREIGVSAGDQLASMRASVTALLVMTIAVLAVQLQAQAAPASARLIASIFVGGVAYLPSLLMLDPEFRSWARRIAARMLRWRKPHSLLP